MRLENKTAIITGAASGFGEGIARRFALEGAKVAIADIDAKAAEKVAASITRNGGSAIAIDCDVSDAASVSTLFERFHDAFGGLDILINNAGMPQINQPMLDVDETTFDKIFAVNVKSIYLSAQHAVPALRERGGGVIINTASTAGVRPRPGLTWYNASKGAAITMTRSMALELAPDRIRVNAINPVAGDTPMLGAFMGGEVTNETYAKFVATVPLGRLSTPEDMANAVLFLASDEAEFITGVCLEVDGGRCI